MIRLVRFEEIIDNWGRKELSDDPTRIYEVLHQPEEWTDDMSFESPEDQIFFLDDLIGKQIKIEGYDPFQLKG